MVIKVYHDVLDVIMLVYYVGVYFRHADTHTHTHETDHDNSSNNKTMF